MTPHGVILTIEFEVQVATLFVTLKEDLNNPWGGT